MSERTSLTLAVQRSVGCGNRQTESDLLAAQDDNRIDALVQRRLHKTRDDSANQRRHAVEIDRFDINLTENRLLFALRNRRFKLACAQPEKL